MTRPRRHEPPADGAASYAIDIDGVLVTAEQWRTLTDAYMADHPGWSPVRPGIRGSAARLTVGTLPAGWAGQYWHLIDTA